MPSLSRKIKAENTALHFLETNPGASGSIVLLHGNSGSQRMWQQLTASPALKDFRMIAIDLPGHGSSGELSDHLGPYTVIAMGKVVHAAVKELVNNGPFIVAGLSLGTNVLAEAIASGLDAEGYALFSPSILGAGIRHEDTVRETAASVVLYEDAPPATLIEQYIKESLFQGGDNFSNMLREDYHAVKFPLRSDLKASIPAKLYSDELEIIASCNREVICVFGEQDNITNPHMLDEYAANFWQKKIFRIPQAGHQVVLDQPDVCIALLKEFTTACFYK